MSKPKIKPAVSGKKQPPPKKITPKERIVVAKKNSDVIQNKKPRIKLAPVKPHVFQDCHHRTFLLLEEKSSHNRYITVRDEEMQVIKLPHDLPARNDNGQLKTQETTSTTDLHAIHTPKGEPYNLQKAALKLYESFIVRNAAATRELCIMLGKPVPEVSEEVKQTRKATGERLRAAREQRQQQSTSTTKEHDMTTKAKASKKSAPKANGKSKVATNGDSEKKIALLVKENPKRAGSDSHKRYELYKKHTTVGAFLGAGGQRSDLSWDAKHKFIKVGA